MTAETTDLARMTDAELGATAEAQMRRPRERRA
jgi:hypothetical protein